MAEEILNQGQQENAENLNENVSGQAKEIISAALEETQNRETSPALKADSNVTDKFKGLPMRELIAAPLIAAAEAQQELAATAWNFYQQIAFDGKSGNKARILEFDVERPIQQNEKMTTIKQTVKAPFIGLVPIPALLIDRVDVDFQMEVTDTSNVKSTTNAEVEAKASAKHWFINAEISGKVTTARENTRMTNQTAKYQIHVTASQQPQTEGLSKLMDIMASCIEPITNESNSK